VSYAVKAIFDTIQGEGARAGTRAVFIRLAGCNLWDGRPEHRDRGKGACARWCDTDFVGGEKMTAEAVAERAKQLWTTGDDRWVVISGGEPTLQVDPPLIDALHKAGFRIAMETNGTDNSDCLDDIDWITVSPKLGGEVVLTRGSELKVVLPGAVGGEQGWTDQMLLDLASRSTYRYKFVQPMDPLLSTQTEDTLLHPRTLYKEPHQLLARDAYDTHLIRCLSFVRAHPDWRLGAQLHKVWQLP